MLAESPKIPRNTELVVNVFAGFETGWVFLAYPHLFSFKKSHSTLNMTDQTRIRKMSALTEKITNVE